MATKRKQNPVKNTDIDKELAEVDKLFKRLENDKSLPTFGQHFMYCLIFGIGERVNLKTLYPKHYKELSTWLQRHNEKILSGRV